MLIGMKHTLVQIREKLREKLRKVEGMPSMMRSHRQCGMITSGFLQREEQMGMMVMMMMMRRRRRRRRRTQRFSSWYFFCHKLFHRYIYSPTACCFHSDFIHTIYLYMYKEGTYLLSYDELLYHIPFGLD